MKNLLLAPLLLGLIPSANAGVYYYLDSSYSDKSSIKVKCADGKANHLVDVGWQEIQLEGHGESKYKNPEMSFEFPYAYGRWANPENNMCVYKYLDDEQHKDIELRSVYRCIENKKYCTINF